MPEEVIEQTEETKTVEDNYIEKIQELKANSVSKDEYEKVMADNRKLLDAITNGQPAAAKVEPAEEIDLDDLRDSLFNHDNTNLEYCEKALKLRDELIRRGEGDPFLPTGYKIAPTDEDINAAQKVADALKDCIDYAQGDSEVFTNELQRIMVDVAPLRRR